MGKQIQFDKHMRDLGLRSLINLVVKFRIFVVEAIKVNEFPKFFHIVDDHLYLSGAQSYLYLSVDMTAVAHVSDHFKCIIYHSSKVLSFANIVQISECCKDRKRLFSAGRVSYCIVYFWLQLATTENGILFVNIVFLFTSAKVEKNEYAARGHFTVLCLPLGRKWMGRAETENNVNLL